MQSRRAMLDGMGVAAPAAAAGVELKRMRCPPPRYQGPTLEQRLRALAARIDWNGTASQLIAHDLSTLSAEVRATLDALADELRPHAIMLGINPDLLVIALAAQSLGEGDRAAMRVARMLLAPLAADRLAELSQSLALQPAAI